MTLFKIILHFFKTWFLPLPAHDEIELEQAASAPTTPESAADSLGTPPNFPGETPEEGPPAQDNPPPFVPEPDPDTEDAEALARPEPPLPDQSTTDFSHLVKPPEGSESRVDRKSFLDDTTDGTIDETPVSSDE